MNSIYKILPIILLSGCASIIHGTSDQITVTSLEKDAVISVDGVARGKDTTMAEVKRGRTHQLKASKPNCQDTIAETSRSFDLTSLFGVLIDFGIITIPLDFIIGGAMETSPKIYTLTPVCK